MASRRPSADTPPNPATLRTAALTLLSRRDYTSSELTSKLTDRGFEPDAVAEAVADLISRGFLDDRRTAAAHVRRASAIKGRGRVRISRELSARGLSREIIDDALKSIAHNDELAAIRKILARKRWPANPSRLERRRMYRHLLGRGFPTDLIARALGRCDENGE